MISKFNIGQYITIVLLIVSVVFFATDAVLDVVEHIRGGDPYTIEAMIHLLFEILAAGLLGYSTRTLITNLRTTAAKAKSAESQVEMYKAGAQNLLESRFKDWALTEAEQDIALFVLKGLSNNDIASLRGVALGTTKNQITAILRKAGVSSRSELLSLLIEEMFDFSSLEKYR